MNDYQKRLDVLIARKGLNKFFDIIPEFILAKTRYNESDLEPMKANIKNYMLAPVKKAILEGNKIEVLKTLKANGENCQISWNKELETWIIASKNVGLAVTCEEDINDYEYTKGFNRYKFAILMGRCWFKILSKMSKEKQESLKKDIASKTMVGEYVGNKDY